MSSIIYYPTMYCAPIIEHECATRPIQIDAATGHPNVAVAASGGVVATEGSHVAGHPQQDRSNTTIGAFAGVEGGLLLSNAGNSQGLKQPSETISVDFGWGLSGSVSWTILNGNIVSVNVGIGFGFGAAFSDINTATAAKGTDW